MKLLLIEHGQTALDRRGDAHGDRDAPLDDTGRRQAVALGSRLKRMTAKPPLIYASDRRRARQTAQIAGRVAGVPVKLAPELRPLAAGPAGQGPQEQVARRLAPYFAHPEQKIPGGETVQDWRDRHLGFMRRVAKRAQRDGTPPPALVTHSNVVGSAIAAAKGKSADGARTAMAHPPKAATPVAVEIGTGGGK